MSRLVNCLLGTPTPAQPPFGGGAPPLLQRVSESSITDHRNRGVLEGPPKHRRKAQSASLNQQQEQQQQEQQQQQGQVEHP